MAFQGTFALTSPATVGPVNLLSHPNGVFLRETQIGHSTIDFLGRRSTIRRIPIRSNHGEVEFDDLQAGTRDMVDVSGQKIRSLHFRLTDDENDTINPSTLSHSA